MRADCIEDRAPSYSKLYFHQRVDHLSSQAIKLLGLAVTKTLFRQSRDVLQQPN
jgi:hypothetical protein